MARFALLALFALPLPAVLALPGCTSANSSVGPESAGGSSGSAGTPAAGSAGASNVAGDSNGGAGGTANGGTGGTLASAGSGGDSGSAGAIANGGGGGFTDPACPGLFEQARSQLDTARSCDPTSTTGTQCTGSVPPTCGCNVGVNAQDSPATSAYLTTLQNLKQKQCVQTCPQVFCPSTAPECVAQAGTSHGVCVLRPLH